jgi:hypothetical protein
MFSNCFRAEVAAARKRTTLPEAVPSGEDTAEVGPQGEAGEAGGEAGDDSSSDGSEDGVEPNGHHT